MNEVALKVVASRKDASAACDAARERGAANHELRALAAQHQINGKTPEDKLADFIAAVNALPGKLPQPTETQSSTPDRLARALSIASRGFRIFPLKPNSKEPACMWQQEATTHPAMISAWFCHSPGMNYGVAFEPDQFALDLDTKGGKNGVADLLNLELDHGDVPVTFTVRTPSGGEHRYFAGSAPNSVGKKTLGPGIDVRGEGGYVVGPGSIIDGKAYEIIDTAEIAPAPAWLLELTARKPVEPAKRDPNIALDEPHVEYQMRDYLCRLVEQGDVAIEYHGGNDRTFKLACHVMDYVSPDMALDLIVEIWNPHCWPRWSHDELKTIVANAAEYRENDVGSSATLPAAETFKDFVLPEVPPSEPLLVPTDKLLHAIPFSDLLTREMKPIEEIIPGLIEKGIATMLSGPGGTHKSRVALQWGHCIDAGIPIYGHPVMRSTFIYLDYENGMEEMTRRTQKMNWRLDLPSCNGLLFDLKRHGGPLAIVSETAAEIELTAAYHSLIAYLRSISGHKFVVMDSCYNVLRFLGQAKINETLVKEAINLLDNICADTDSTMMFLWHPSQAGQERGDASGWSVAWHNSPRARLSLSKVKDAQDTYNLKVEKRNNGPTGVEITLHWQDGVLLPLSDVDSAQQSSLFLDACVKVAITSAEHGAPITKQKNLYKWQVDEIEKGAGSRPSQKEIKEQLARALGSGRLRYIKGHGKQQAGYFPIETDPVWLRQTGIDTAKELRPST
jgi:hypothetical protein